MPGPAHQRPLHPGGRGRRATERVGAGDDPQPPNRVRFSELQPAVANLDAGERRVAAVLFGVDRRRRASRRRPGETGRAGGPRAEPSQSTLGRAAAARGDRARAGKSPVDTARRRADRQSRLDQLGRDNGGAHQAQSRTGHDGDRGDARSGRGGLRGPDRHVSRRRDHLGYAKRRRRCARQRERQGRCAGHGGGGSNGIAGRRGVDVCQHGGGGGWSRDQAQQAARSAHDAGYFHRRRGGDHDGGGGRRGASIGGGANQQPRHQPADSGAGRDDRQRRTRGSGQQFHAYGRRCAGDCAQRRARSRW